MRPWIEAAHLEHPSLIDHAHVLDELFGITNVPTAVATPSVLRRCCVGVAPRPVGEAYESDWARDVQRIGPENYYPVLELD